MSQANDAAMGSTIHPAPVSNRWSLFAQAPARYLSARSISQCFDGSLTPEAIRQMQVSPRIQADLKTLLAEHHDLGAIPDDHAMEIPDIALTLMPCDEFSNFFQACGATLWANVLAAEIRASTILELKSRIGENAYKTALQNRDLSLAYAPPTDIEVLLSNIERDSASSLASWIGWLPTSAQGWVRLKLPSSQINAAPFSGATDSHVRAVVNRLAAPTAGGNQ